MSSSTSPSNPVSEDDPFDLDFTRPQNSPAPAVKTTAPLELAPLELAPLELMPVEPPPLAPPPPPVFPRVRLDALVEQAALHYAEGRGAQARQVLEEAVQGGQAVEAVWRMLFDVYRLAEESEKFENLAIEFASRLEKSPPAWDAVVSLKKAEAAVNEGRASISLTGALNARCAQQFGQLVQVAKTRSLLRLDLAKLQDADNGGCALLLGTLQSIRKTDCELMLGNAEHLAGMLQGKIKEGSKEDEAIWLLLLDLYQYLGPQERYEDVAFAYLSTFEVSPPEWKAQSQGMQAADEGEIEDLPEFSINDEEVAAITLSGEILAAQPDRFEALNAECKADSKSDVIIDATELKRIDQSSIQALYEVLQGQLLDGRRVRVRGLRHLVAAMFEMAGLGEMAVLERSRV